MGIISNLFISFTIDLTMFLSAPELEERNDELYIGGCRYQYFQDLRLNVSLLWNNGSLPSQNSSYEPAIDNSSGLMKIFLTPYYKVESFLNVGRYRCKIHLENRSVFFSKAATFGSFPGSHG